MYLYSQPFFLQRGRGSQDGNRGGFQGNRRGGINSGNRGGSGNFNQNNFGSFNNNARGGFDGPPQNVRKQNSLFVILIYPFFVVFMKELFGWLQQRSK